jgi:hypothetical protein
VLIRLRSIRCRTNSVVNTGLQSLLCSPLRRGAVAWTVTKRRLMEPNSINSWIKLLLISHNPAAITYVKTIPLSWERYGKRTVETHFRNISRWLLPCVWSKSRKKCVCFRKTQIMLTLHWNLPPLSQPTPLVGKAKVCAMIDQPHLMINTELLQKSNAYISLSGF